MSEQITPQTEITAAVEWLTAQVDTAARWLSPGSGDAMTLADQDYDEFICWACQVIAEGREVLAMFAAAADADALEEAENGAADFREQLAEIEEYVR
jgi:hypothetical protein